MTRFWTLFFCDCIFRFLLFGYQFIISFVIVLTKWLKFIPLRMSVMIQCTNVLISISFGGDSFHRFFGIVFMICEIMTFQNDSWIPNKYEFRCVLWNVRCSLMCILVLNDLHTFSGRTVVLNHQQILVKCVQLSQLNTATI